LHPNITGFGRGERMAFAPDDGGKVDDILTPSLVPVAFAWVVVLDYEQALGCADLGDGEEGTILVIAHDDFL